MKAVQVPSLPAEEISEWVWHKRWPKPKQRYSQHHTTTAYFTVYESPLLSAGEHPVLILLLWIKLCWFTLNLTVLCMSYRNIMCVYVSVYAVCLFSFKLENFRGHMKAVLNRKHFARIISYLKQNRAYSFLLLLSYIYSCCSNKSGIFNDFWLWSLDIFVTRQW